MWHNLSYSQEGCLDTTKPGRECQSISCFVPACRKEKTNIVYIITPRGSRKQAAGVGTPSKVSLGQRSNNLKYLPVSALKAALPPVKSIAVTRILVINPNTVKTKWVVMPYLITIFVRSYTESEMFCNYLAFITSRKVCDSRISILIYYIMKHYNRSSKHRKY
jgi:hypothetical protein